MSNVKKDQCKRGQHLIWFDVKRPNKLPQPLQPQPHKTVKDTHAIADELFVLSILWGQCFKVLKIFVDIEIFRKLLMKSQTLIPKFLMTLR